MLCASSEQLVALVATNSQTPTSTHSNHPLSRQIPLLHDPYDARIEKEYEQLVQHWTQQLLSKSRRIYQNNNDMHTATPAQNDNSNRKSTTTTKEYSKHEDTKVPFTPSSNASSSPLLSEGSGATFNNNHYHDMAIIEQYLEEQWMDSQHILKCAQAWNGRDTLDITEAVHAMNIISLRLMQRTLETRQKLNPIPRAGQEEQHAYMPLFSPQSSQQHEASQKHQADTISSSNNSMSSCSHVEEEDESVQWRPHHSPSLASLPKVPIVQDAPKGFVADKATTVPRISSSLSMVLNNKKAQEEDYEYEEDNDYEEQEMHAPLLRRHQTDSCIILGTSSGDSTTASTATKAAAATTTTTTDWTHDKLKKKPSLQTIEQHAAAAMATSGASSTSPPGNHLNSSRRPLRLVPSPSAPDYSSLTNGCCFNSFAPATNYRRYYPQHQWREEGQVEEVDEYEDDYDAGSSNNGSSSCNSPNNHIHHSTSKQQSIKWKSWFHHQQHQRHENSNGNEQVTQPLLFSESSSSSCAFCYNPVPKKSLSAGDAEDAQLLPSSCCTSGDSSTEDNQSTSYHSALAAFEKTLLEEVDEMEQQQYDDSDDEEAKPLLLPKDHLFSDSGKHLAEEDEVVESQEDIYQDLVTSYNGGIMGVGGVPSNTIIRSESSISAFRPISKNLAPRCSAIVGVRESTCSKPFLYRDSLSCSSLFTSSTAATKNGASGDGDAVMGQDTQQSSFKTKIPTITKSQSFPSKVATMSESRPALPTMATSLSSNRQGEKGGLVSSGTSVANSNNKERNFVMRSIVSKKASLSKLFHAKK